jgi:hypothetical protein
MTLTQIDKLQEACTTIVQSLRFQDNGDPAYSNIVAHVHSLCDAIEANAELGRTNAELGLEMMQTIKDLVDQANEMIQARKPLPPTSADDQPGEEA